MKPIIAPVDRALLLEELTPRRKVRDTNKASNEIYIFEASECPALMREVGRLREIAFRQGGGGTGQEVDIDEEDLAGDGPTASAVVADLIDIARGEFGPPYAMPAQALAADLGLAYQSGNMLAEVRVAGSDKGVAVGLLMQPPPPTPDTIAAFVAPMEAERSRPMTFAPSLAAAEAATSPLVPRPTTTTPGIALMLRIDQMPSPNSSIQPRSKKKYNGGCTSWAA